MTAKQLRSSVAWQRARARALEGATHCGICHGLLDFDAPARSRWSPSVDHIVALAHGGPALDQSNLRPVHYGCNSRSGAPIGNQSAKRSVSRPQAYGGRADWRKLVVEDPAPRRERATWW